MERTRVAHRWRLSFLVAGALAAIVLLRQVLWALIVQLCAGALLMLLALPLCRMLERRLPPSLASALSLLLLGAMTVLALMLLIPPIARQMTQLTAAFPDLLEWAQAQWTAISGWLSGRGVDLSPMKEQLFSQISSQAAQLLPRVMSALTNAVSGLSKVLLAPLLAFYLLRDRKRIASMLTLLLPVRHRAQGVRAAREMRREAIAYLRGQLLLSLSVAALTAAGLLLTGTPGWLLLGVLMGVMELVPYVGPVIAGVPAVLLSLQNGLMPALWTLAVLLLIQQLEGAVLSPRLLSGATRLHPMLVLLAISAGGMVGGAIGMVAVIPLVVSLRGALRGWRN
ncbi:MAG: AI-2E family transporter [Clostridia bacterium]|nr:AI-2E family transporter [Clostridia bacterium]